jgi:hypothetical protein
MRLHPIIGLSLLVLGLTASLALAQEKKSATLDPKEAGVEFELQGEYTGEIKSDDGAQAFGVQVIALGEDKFRAVAYPGGLPGAGWNAEEKIEKEGKLENGEVRFEAENARGILKPDGTLTIEVDSQTVGTLRKDIRKSDTLGQKPPEGAVVLFDGTTADKFQGGKLTEEGLLEQGVTSKQKFQGFKLHMEFQLSFMPEAQGQARSNSGVYMQGRYEVQILDSFGLEGKNNECGGIYEIKDTAVNMCFPPLSWQTYDIDYTPAKFDADGKKTANARMTVRHNGVLIHDDVELPRGTRAAPVAEGPDPGPIYIQDHGNPVRFRNIWLVEK